jgi:hypothetical protein
VRWNSGNVCCDSVQNLLSPRLLSKNAKLEKPIVLHVVLYGHEIWFLTLREEYRPRMIENRVLRICG